MMGIGDILLCVFLPPFAKGVRGRGCGSMLLVGLLWACFWVPGSIAAFIMTMGYEKEPPVIVIQQPPQERPLD